MSISYQSKDDAVLGLQLKVQELCVKKSDTSIVTVSGNDVLIDVKETVGDIRCAIHCDAAGPSLALVSASKSGSVITVSLGAPIGASDSIIVKYVIAEQ